MAELRAFVCGHPIAHSRSPMIHRHWLADHGIGGSYEAIDVAPEAFPAFLAGLRQNGFVGGNVTIPHKEAAFRLVERRTPEAEAIGAVNTLWLEDDVLWGTNTDAYGFIANLDETARNWDRQPRTAAIIGAGGASRAVVYGLRQRGFNDIRILNRTLERAKELAASFGETVSAHSLASAPETLGGASLVVNTTALGMSGKGDSDTSLPVDPRHIDANALVTDIVYVPIETPFLAAARRCGLRTADGLGMLLHQAVPGFELWFGRRPKVRDELRQKIIADIESHA